MVRAMGDGHGILSLIYSVDLWNKVNGFCDVVGGRDGNMKGHFAKIPEDELSRRAGLESPQLATMQSFYSIFKQPQTLIPTPSPTRPTPENDDAIDDGQTRSSTARLPVPVGKGQVQHLIGARRTAHRQDVNYRVPKVCSAVPKRYLRTSRSRMWR